MNLTKHAILQRKRRQLSIDPTLPASGGEKTNRVDLGLTLLEMVAKPGVELTQQDIAVWCGCSHGAIWALEKAAMKKLRNKVLFGQAREAGKEMVA